MTRKIVFATGNPGKLREAGEILGEGFEIVSAAAAGVPDDIPETGTTLQENALIKAEYIWELLASIPHGMPVRIRISRRTSTNCSANWKRSRLQTGKPVSGPPSP